MKNIYRIVLLAVVVITTINCAEQKDNSLITLVSLHNSLPYEITGYILRTRNIHILNNELWHAPKIAQNTLKAGKHDSIYKGVPFGWSTTIYLSTVPDNTTENAMHYFPLYSSIKYNQEVRKPIRSIYYKNSPHKKILVTANQAAQKLLFDGPICDKYGNPRLITVEQDENDYIHTVLNPYLKGPHNFYTQCIQTAHRITALTAYFKANFWATGAQQKNNTYDFTLYTDQKIIGYKLGRTIVKDSIKKIGFINEHNGLLLLKNGDLYSWSYNEKPFSLQNLFGDPGTITLYLQKFKNSAAKLLVVNNFAIDEKNPNSFIIEDNKANIYHALWNTIVRSFALAIPTYLNKCAYKLDYNDGIIRQIMPAQLENKKYYHEMNEYKISLFH